MNWKLCLQCGAVTQLTLYCDRCFQANFKKRDIREQRARMMFDAMMKTKKNR